MTGDDEEVLEGKAAAAWRQPWNARLVDELTQAGIPLLVARILAARLYATGWKAGYTAAVSDCISNNDC